MRKERAIDAPSLATVVRRILESDEFDFLYSRLIELSADLFTEHPCAVVTRREERFWVNVAYPARKTLHFPLPVLGDLSAVPMEGLYRGGGETLPEMGDQGFLFFPLAFREEGRVWADGWFCIAAEVEGDPELFGEVSLFVEIAREAVRKIAKLEHIKELTIIDEVTGLYNTRHLFNLLDQAVQQAGRYFTEFSLIFFDLDHFKQVNDTHGHLVGSRLLREVGQFILHYLRKADVAFRYGGDEFVIYLPYTPKQSAKIVVERLWENLRRHEFVIDGIPLQVKASYGLAGFPEDGRAVKEIIEKADEAMYRVKKRSRDAFDLA